MITNRFPTYPLTPDARGGLFGRLPEAWGASRIKLLFQVRKDIAGRLGYPVWSVTQHGLREKDITSGEGQLSMDYSKYQLVRVGDLVMNHMDLITGGVDVGDCEGVTSPDYRVFVARAPERIDKRYYVYVFRVCYWSKLFYSMGQGSAHLGRWRLPRGAFEGLVVPVPSREEQTQIAKFLDYETLRIDALIEKQQQLIALLKEKRQAVISHAVTKGLNPDAPMRDSGVEWLGDVPAHWDFKIIKRLFRQEKRQGFTELEVLSVYRDFGVILKSSRADNINKTPDDVSAYQLVNADDLVINKMKAWQGSLGISPHQGITSPDYLVYTPQHAEHPLFLHHLLRASHMPKVYLSVSNGIRPSQWRLEPGKFEKLAVALPPLEEQRQITVYLNSTSSRIDDLIQSASQQTDLLQERRTALISAAVTGKIDVRDWKAPKPEMEEVVA